jgi:hypothetical protein
VPLNTHAPLGLKSTIVKRVIGGKAQLFIFVKAAACSSRRPVFRRLRNWTTGESTNPDARLSPARGLKPLFW